MHNVLVLVGSEGEDSLVHFKVVDYDVASVESEKSDLIGSRDTASD
jgi:hypothetical protein